MGTRFFVLVLTATLCSSGARGESCAEAASALEPVGALETCTNGLPGIDGSSEAGISVCCPINCGTCGGAGCSSSDRPDSDCCPNEIIDSDPGDCADTVAAPCVMTGEALFPVGDGQAKKVFVTPESGLDLSSMFACEGGEFHVLWSGAVTVPETIYIGPGTTVWVVGSGNSSLGDSGNSSQQGRVEALSTALPPLPNGLTAAAVRTVPQEHNVSTTSSTVAASAEDVDTTAAQPGPVFYVDGGQLFLRGLAVRGGYTTATSADDAVGSSSSSSSSSSSKSGGITSVVSGGGLHAVDANVTVTGCEFEDNFAEHLGGGIFTNRSTLVVVGSVFRRCRADTVPSPEYDAEGAGGGIGVENSDVLIDGSLFDDCYASKKGGGFHQEDGHISVINSLFSNNSVGMVNEENEVPFGEGGGASFIDCHRSFDGMAACEVNDTVFVNNDAAYKGGAVVYWSKSAPSLVEFHRCSAQSNNAGEGFKDDPQGHAGAFAVGGGTTIVLADCLVEDNFAGDRGGVMAMSKGDDPEDGPVAILRNSSFSRNRAGEYQGGVVHMSGYAFVQVEGDANVFTHNEVTDSGGVFAGVETSALVVEGGEFLGNKAEKGGVAYSVGNITILGGNFRGNFATAEGEARGGVVFGPAGSTITIQGGVFEGNHAKDGGVVYLFSGAALALGGGEFSGNIAENTGGGISVLDDADLEITGGRFVSNKADFGGFLYKKGAGRVSCTGASIERNQAVDGGGVYAVENATLSWSCDLVGNSALSGPAVYARDNSNVVVRGATLVDNVADAGPVVLVVSSSNFRTYEVVISDTLGSSDVSAVQLDQNSSYKAEDTSFVGFAGEAVVFSRGALWLDCCDFSHSSASTLVYSEGDAPMIRNAVLGDANYFDDNMRPKAESLVNVNVTCDGWLGEGKEGMDGSSTSTSSPCSDGSCLDGDFGVYCICYVRDSDLEEVCLDGDVEYLNITTQEYSPNEMYREDTPATNLLLTLGNGSASNTINTLASGGGGGEGKVVWTVSGTSFFDPFSDESGVLEDGMMDWTVVPSTGMLLPGQSIDVQVATIPSDDFDGQVIAKFVANGAAKDTTAEVGVEIFVPFFHCYSGEVWKNVSDEHGGVVKSCELCTDVVEYGIEGVDCSWDGSTTRTLSIKPGFWRSTLDSFVIHECLNADACSGGSSVASVAEYCNEGYEGPLCAVCSTGYGSGVASSCHRCSEDFKAGMYVMFATVSLLALALATLLVVYLVGGTGAVTTTISKTKSVASGPGRPEHRRCLIGGVHRVSRSTANTGRGVDAGSGPAVPAQPPRLQGAREVKREKRTIASRVVKVLRGLPLSKLKIVIVVWQISSSFAGITEVPFPSLYERFLGMIGIFSFDLGWILSAACLATGLDFFNKLLIVTIGPAFLLSLLGITFCLGLKKHQSSRRNTSRAGGGIRAIGDSGSGDTSDTASRSTEPPLRARWFPRLASLKKRAPVIPEGMFEMKEGNQPDSEQDRLWNLFARHTTLALIILYLVYSQVSTVVIQVFSCQTLPEIRKSYLRADFRIECDTPKHNAYKIYAAIMICIYPLGIPAAFCYFLVRQRSRINPPVNPGDDKQAINEKREADRAISPTFFLWSPFVPNRYYYEVLECFRRLLLTGLLVFLQPDTSGQIAFGCIFAFISLMVFEVLQPHADHVERQLYRTGCLLIFFTNFLALTIKAEVASPDSSGSAAYSVVLVISNACFFLAAFSNSWLVAKDAMANRDIPVTDMVLGFSVNKDVLVRRTSSDPTQSEQKLETDEETAAD